MNIELKPKYKNETFGKPNKKGNWDIRGDLKTYILYVDDVSVITISIEYERFDISEPNYSCAYITYDNYFCTKEDSQYNNKGYATMALKKVTEILLEEGLVPKITLNILPSNAKSKRVAEKAGYVYINNHDYSIFHPDAIKMYEEGLSYLQDDDTDIYELQMQKYLLQYQKYLENIQPTDEDIITK